MLHSSCQYTSWFMMITGHAFGKSDAFIDCHVAKIENLKNYNFSDLSVSLILPYFLNFFILHDIVP